MDIICNIIKAVKILGLLIKRGFGVFSYTAALNLDTSDFFFGFK